MRSILILLLLLSSKVIAQQTVFCQNINANDKVYISVFKIDYHFFNDSLIIDSYNPTNIEPKVVSPTNSMVVLDTNQFYLIYFEEDHSTRKKYIFIEVESDYVNYLDYTADFSTPYSLIVTYDRQTKSYKSKKFIL